MNEEEGRRPLNGIDRRTFRRYAAAGSATFRQVARAEGESEGLQAGERRDELTAFHPGARAFASPERPTRRRAPPSLLKQGEEEE